ncbi:MAG: ribbon-helix-helix domain-containing protein [Candidatus Methanoplasma sp.]|nr:ribbon-helix-helix domain-containing protein [Candidatus Methanoplasma sp.]
MSVYIDDETLEKLEARSEQEGISVSKIVVKALKERFSNTWPDNFRDLFGSIDDDTFVRPEQPPLDDDAPRKKYDLFS